MVLILSLKDLGLLQKLNQKQFPDKTDCYEFLMLEIQKHLVEINDLKENRDPHTIKEIIDLSILTRMLALTEGADKDMFKERFGKFQKNIKASI
ncbi:MAG: hypothetical protein ABIC04_03635 [Nanoarchaeota archaeon]